MDDEYDEKYHMSEAKEHFSGLSGHSQWDGYGMFDFANGVKEGLMALYYQNEKIIKLLEEIKNK